MLIRHLKMKSNNGVKTTSERPADRIQTASQNSRTIYKASLRFFANNRGFSLLNIAGLSIGTLCCIYILVYVREEYGYDRYFTDAEQIYRVTSSVKAGDKAFQPEATTPTPLAPALAADFPGMLATTRIGSTFDHELLVKYFLAELKVKG